MAGTEPANVVPLEPKPQSATPVLAVLRAVQARLKAIAASGLCGEARAVYEALLLFIDENGQCYPGQRTLCERTGLHRRHLYRGITLLEENGFLRRDQRWREDGARSSDLYTLLEGGTEDGAGGHQTLAPKTVRGVAPNGGTEDGARTGEAENRTSNSLNPEERVSESDVDGRSAPLHPIAQHEANAEPATPTVRDEVAYADAVKASKRRNWLAGLNLRVSKSLRGHEREEAWEAIAEASKVETRAATPKWARQILDGLDKRFRRESAISQRDDRRPGSVAAAAHRVLAAGPLRGRVDDFGLEGGSNS
jgi:helix-turn-helix protein